MYFSSDVSEQLVHQLFSLCVWQLVSPQSLPTVLGLTGQLEVPPLLSALISALLLAQYNSLINKSDNWNKIPMHKKKQHFMGQNFHQCEQAVKLVKLFIIRVVTDKLDGV